MASRVYMWFVLCALAIQPGLALHVANANVVDAKQYATHDTVLICTGKDMKWVSLSQSELAGQFVFVSPPGDIQQVDCVNKVLADSHSASVDVFANLSSQFTPFVADAYLLYQATLRSLRFVYGQTRAPPSLSF